MGNREADVQALVQAVRFLQEALVLAVRQQLPSNGHCVSCMDSTQQRSRFQLASPEARCGGGAAMLHGNARAGDKGVARGFSLPRVVSSPTQHGSVVVQERKRICEGGVSLVKKRLKQIAEK